MTVVRIVLYISGKSPGTRKVFSMPIISVLFQNVKVIHQFVKRVSNPLYVKMRIAAELFAKFRIPG
jgi:hypothetical protein